MTPEERARILATGSNHTILHKGFGYCDHCVSEIAQALRETAMTSNEEAVIEAAIEWANLRDGAQYVPMELALRKAAKALENAVADMMGDRA